MEARSACLEELRLLSLFSFIYLYFLQGTRFSISSLFIKCLSCDRHITRSWVYSQRSTKQSPSLFSWDLRVQCGRWSVNKPTSQKIQVDYSTCGRGLEVIKGLLSRRTTGWERCVSLRGGDASGMN